jgi:beta-galactosidase
MTVSAGNHTVEIWAESYHLNEATSQVDYTSGPMKGLPAVAVNGNVTTIGAWSPTLVVDVLEGVLKDAKIASRRLPEGVRVTKHGDVRVWMNFTEEEVALAGGPSIGPISYAIQLA